MKVRAPNEPDDREIGNQSPQLPLDGSATSRPSRSRSRAAMATLGGSSLNVLIVSLQAILLIPLYLETISPRLYGAWLASGEILVWMQALDLGIPNLMIQRIAAAHGRGDHRAAGEWFASGLLVLGLVGAAVTGMGALFVLTLPSLLGVPPPDVSILQGCFLLGTLAMGVTIFTNGFVGFSRAIQDTAFMSGMLIVSSLAGFVTSLVLLLGGWGLWAIAFGLVARAGVGVVGALLFAVHAWRTEFRVPFRIERGAMTQLLTASPVTALGGVSYAVMSQSEILLVAALLRPELAVVYALTRKAADVGRSLVDMIGFATYGGLAHVIGADDRTNAQKMYSRILGLHLSMAVAVAAAYLAVNRSLIDVWLEPGVFGGLLLVCLMALQAVVLGHSYLSNLMYRATGRVVEGSLALVVEALLRLPLLAAFLLVFGLPGLPIAAIATAATFGLIIRRRMATVLNGGQSPRFSPAVAIGRLLLLAIAGAIAVAVYIPSWPYVLATGTTIAVGGGLLLILLDPNLRGGSLSWAGLLSRARTWAR